MIKLAKANSGADSLDIGFYGLYDTSGSQDLYAGLFRDANDSGKFKLFKDLQVEPTTTVNTSGTGYAVGTLVSNLEGNVTGQVSTLSNHDTDNLSEGSSNLYFTNARSRSAISASGDISYNSSTGVISFTQSTAPVTSVNSATGAVVLDTDDIAEGSSNLYFTNARADTRINLQTGSNLDLSSKSTSDLSEGTNLYYTDTRFDTRLGTKTTDNLTEGSSNLYMTTERVQDIVGGMVTGNTETGITVTYDDSDGTLDFVVGTLNQDTTGNAATATALETARTIGGVSFDGTANIDLAGVNTSGNQDTSGNAATATALATGRNFSITGDITASAVSFDGTGNVALSAGIDANTVGISELNVTDGSNGQVLTTDGAGNLSFSTASGTTINNNADNRVITGSGTANTLEGEANFVFDGTNVGIGESSPAGKIHIKGTDVGASPASTANQLVLEDTENGISILSAGAGAGNIAFGDSGDNFKGGFIYDHSADAMRHFTNGGEKMRIDSSGNVGIGTSSPAHEIDLTKTLTGINDNPTIQIKNSWGGEGNNVGFSNNAIGLFSAGNDTVITKIQSSYNSGANYGEIGTQTNHDFVFETNNTERMRIASNGRVGIGTTGGNSGLHVANGDIRCTAAAIANDANSISMSQESTGGFIVARGPSTSQRGRISLTVSRSNGGGGIEGLVVANDGSVSKYSGSFKIDHPLESKKETHHLVHSFVEGPQADNIYRGKVDLVDGSATVNIDTVAGMTEGTFEALNTNVQCFTSNETDWDSVKGTVTGNILTINCKNTSSTANVSWLVIGERHDQHMMDANWTDETGKVIVEPLKEETYKMDLEGE